MLEMRSCKLKAVRAYATAFLATCICLGLVFSLGGCAEESAKSEPASEANTPSASNNQVDFEEFDILKLDIGNKEAIDVSSTLSLVHADCIVQNKSDKESVSNIVVTYFSGNDSDEEDLPIRLAPRKKAEISLSVDSDPAGVDDVSFAISQYSYEMGGMLYNIDLLSKTATADKAEEMTNTDYASANIVAFRESEYLSDRSTDFTNTGTQPIKSLVVKMAVLDEDGTVINIEDVSAVGPGEAPIEPNSADSITVDEISANGGTSVEVVSYEYAIGTADADGYNRYEVSLANETAHGSRDSAFLDATIPTSLADPKTEIESLTALFGKTIEEAGINPESIKETSGLEEIAVTRDFLGLKGKFVFIRDYDTLLVTGFRFEPEDDSEELTNALLASFTDAYGAEYEAHMDGDELDYATWDAGAYRVNLFVQSGTVTALQN